MTDRIDSATEELQRSFERLERTFERVAERIEHLRSEREKLRGEAEDSLRRAAEIGSELEGLNATLAQRDEKIDELTSLLGQRQQELDALSGESASAAERIATLERERDAARDGAEGRVAAAEAGRAELHERISQLERERDQARSTVESMLIRVRQLESNDQDKRDSSQRKIEAMQTDLDAALELAEGKEAEAVALQRRVEELEQALEQSRPGTISDGEAEELAEKIEEALHLIDQHLQGAEKS